MVNANAATLTAPVDTARRNGLALVDNAKRQWHTVEKRLARNPLARLSVAVPRTARWVSRRLFARGQAVPGMPEPRITPGVVLNVALEEAILMLAIGPSRMPSRAEYERVGAELRDMRALFAERGWLANPAAYHRDPPPLDHVQEGHGWALGIPYERIWFDSGWEPRPDEPGYERWMSYVTNRTATAVMLRHVDGPRPWVVCVHGFGMGHAFADFVGFHARRLHRDLGFNLVFPALPLHGPRRVGRFSGEAMLSVDLVNTVHALAQAVWDLRRTISWLRATQQPTKVGLLGVSLGAYTSSLLAGLEDDLDCIVAGIPVSDFPELFHAQSPVHVRMRAIEHNILDGTARDVHRVVSPLAVAPRVARDDRYIFAGLADRMARPWQAHALWKHWDEPQMHWYAGNHVSYLWNRSAWSFAGRSLQRSLLSVESGGTR